MTDLSPLESRMSRRQFVGAASLAAAIPFVQSGPGSPDDVARDEPYWQGVARHFRVPATITNLENGYWGVMARCSRPTRRISIA